MPRPTFVLVHGAWHGGWCWKEVAARLEAQGHRCLAPTLRGLAHRSADLTPAIDADTHVDDIADLVACLDLRPVVLVLHSYAGYLGAALLHRLRQRLAHIALIEAVIPSPGLCMLDLMLPQAAGRAVQAVRDHGDGWRLPPVDAAQFHLPDTVLRAEVQRQLTPHPWRSFAEPVRAAQDELLAFTGSYLIADDRDPQPYADFAARARQAGWPVRAVSGGHLLMLTAPAAVSDFLLASLQQHTGNDPR